MTITPLPEQRRESLAREVFAWLRKSLDKRLITRLFGMGVLILAFVGIHKSLHALTVGLAWADPRWKQAVAPLAIAVGIGAFGLGRAWNRYKDKQRRHRLALQNQPKALVHIESAAQTTIVSPSTVAQITTVDATVTPLPPHAQQMSDTHAAHELKKQWGALVTGLLTVIVLAFYLLVYHQSVVKLDDFALSQLQRNAAPDTGDAHSPAQAAPAASHSESRAAADTGETRSFAEAAPGASHSDAHSVADATLAPRELILPLPPWMPGELSEYRTNIVRRTRGVGASDSNWSRAGWSEIVSQDPQWLYDKLEHDYTGQVALTKATLLITYVLVFVLAGLTAGLSYEQVEALAGMFTS